MTSRRDLLVALGAGALTVPLPTFAQQQRKVWRVGFLSQSARPVSLDTDIFWGFQQTMRKLGYISGENLSIEWRFAEHKIDSLQDLARELVGLNVDVVVASGTPAAKAVQAATSTIPIVIDSGDAVGAGLVRSLSRPGGNITGVTNINLEISPKRLEMLLNFVPKLQRVAVLTNPGNANGALMFKYLQPAAQKIGVSIFTAGARTAQEIEDAFAAIVLEKAGAVIVAQDQFFIQNRIRIAALALKHRLPSISGYREFAEVGGLTSYGADFSDIYRLIAVYVDKIIKGAKPSDLPVEQPTKLELIVNSKTAKTLGLKIPQSLLIMANKVIE